MGGLIMTPISREALLVVAGNGRAIDSRRLGNWLSSIAGRIVGGKKLSMAGISRGNRLWQLSGGGSGVSGGSISSTPRENPKIENHTVPHALTPKNDIRYRVAENEPPETPEPPCAADLAPGEEIPL
jgi:hypothetical protein